VHVHVHHPRRRRSSLPGAQANLVPESFLATQQHLCFWFGFL
jgi:hypothetical protein